jgi:predicted nucleic acid-binding protein
VTDALADTSFFIGRETGRPMRIERVPERIGVSFVTIGELRTGVLTALDADSRGRRLRTLLIALSLDPIAVDDAVAEAWARLQVNLRDRHLRMPVNDSWIAATAIAHGVPLVTQDEDYADVPGLEVIRV